MSSDYPSPYYSNFAGQENIQVKGVSLLLRDSLEIPGGNSPTATTELAAKDQHVCITDHKATVRERVSDTLTKQALSSRTTALSSFHSPHTPATPYFCPRARPRIRADASPVSHLLALREYVPIYTAECRHRSHTTSGSIFRRNVET